MWLWDYLFSFRGRINRAKFWAYYLVQFGAFFVLVAALQGAITFEGGFGGVESPFDLRVLPLAILSFGVFLPVGFARLTTFVKRLHDRDKSAWWLAVYYGPSLMLFATLPFIISIGNDRPVFPPLLPLLFVPAWLCQFWAFVELHFFPGTPGDNRYGPDPLTRPD